MFTDEQVRHIARLARLELSDAEIQTYKAQLGRVLDYVRDLEAIPIQEASLVKHIPRDAVAFRGDRVLPFPGTSALMENAPAVSEGEFALSTAVVEHE